MKRALDILVSSVVLAILSPVLLAIWVAVRLTSPGPAVFQQERLGRYRVPFTMYKFRTMYVDSGDEVHRAYVRQLLTADEAPTGGENGLYKLESDPRITRLGGWLRRTSLDELPQLVNVLRGDMSLVGPRPVLEWEAELFSETECLRFEVPPGITGLWQVSGRNQLSMRDALELDVEYVARQSFVYDLTLLVRTVPAVLKRGAA
jgi:lipopolysaccharide/colanic/teichoic acid biosynthesis glycosyltransferase